MLVLSVLLRCCCGVVLGLFGFHYTNRTLVFPFLIRGGKPTTFVPFISALL